MSLRAPRRPVTAREVAERAGCSTATVSLVVNGKSEGRVTAATQERVWAAVRELDYRVHSAARTLATGSPGTVAFVCPDPTNPFFSMLLEGLLDGLDDRLSLSLVAPRGGDDYDLATVRRVQSGDLAALVLASPSDDVVRELRSGRPVILIDSGVRFEGASTIDVDIPEASRLLADHLVDLGHRRIVYMGVDRAKFTLRRRREVFAQRLRERGATLVGADVAVPRMTMDTAYRATLPVIDRWLESGVTAVVCADDLLAFGVLRAARDREVSVPGRLSVAGFNDMPYAGMVAPSLTSIDLRARDLGRGTAALLSEQLAAVEPSATIIPPRLRVRESTGPAG